MNLQTIKSIEGKVEYILLPVALSCLESNGTALRVF